MAKIYSVFSIFTFFSVVVIGSASDFHHCFNVLEKYRQDQIERIHSLTLDGVSKTSPAKEIFSCYLKETRQDVKTEIEKYFDIYKKCNEYKAGGIISMSQKQMDELEEMGLPLYLQVYLRERIDLRNGMAVVDYTQNDLGKKIELSKQYTDYRTLLLKYGKSVENRTSGQIRLYSTSIIQISILLMSILVKRII